MNNIRFEHIEDYNDIVTRSYYTNLLGTKGVDAAADYLEQQKREGRDNARTPMQWSSEPQAGFTTGSTTWLKVNSNYLQVNVAAEEADSLSVLHYFRMACALRHTYKSTLVYGDYSLVDAQNPTVFSYLRAGNEQRILVAINFSALPAKVEATLLKDASPCVLLDNYLDNHGLQVSEGKLSLRPWQAQVVLL